MVIQHQVRVGCVKEKTRGIHHILPELRSLTGLRVIRVIRLLGSACLCLLTLGLQTHVHV